MYPKLIFPDKFIYLSFLKVWEYFDQDYFDDD